MAGLYGWEVHELEIKRHDDAMQRARDFLEEYGQKRKVLLVLHINGHGGMSDNKLFLSAKKTYDTDEFSRKPG